MPFVVYKRVLFRESYPVFLYRVWLNTLYSAPRYPIPYCMVGYRVNSCKSANIKRKGQKRTKRTPPHFQKVKFQKALSMPQALFCRLLQLTILKIKGKAFSSVGFNPFYFLFNIKIITSCFYEAYSRKIHILPQNYTSCDVLLVF